MSYAERLTHPKWQRRRLEIMSRAEFRCEKCGNDELELHVHHRAYRDGAMPWEYEDDELICLCVTCHDYLHEKVYSRFDLEAVHSEIARVRKESDGWRALNDTLYAKIQELLDRETARLREEDREAVA